MKKVIILLTAFCMFNIFAQALPDGLKTSTKKESKIDGKASSKKENIGDGSSLPSTAPQQTNYNRKAIDLIVFPNVKEFIAGMKYFSSSIEYKWEYLSQNYLDGEITSNGFQYAAGYAFDDYWGLRIDVEQVLSQKSKVTYGPVTVFNGQSVETKNDGFDDPQFSLLYRAMDISRDRYDMNLSLHFSPKLQDAETGTASKKGNNAKGRTNFGLEVEWGRRTPTFSWAAGLELSSYGKAESKDADDGDLTTISSYSTFTASGKFQWVVSSKVALDLNLALGSTGEYDVKYADGSRYNYESATTFLIGGAANITLQDKLYLVFDLAGVAVGDRTVTDEVGVTVTDTDRSAGIFKIGMIKQF